MIDVWEPKEEKKAFAFFLKAPRELHSLRACGREFHSAAPLQEKLLFRYSFLGLGNIGLFDDFYSDDDFRSGCRNVSQCHHKQSFSGLHSPGRSQFTEL